MSIMIREGEFRTSMEIHVTEILSVYIRKLNMKCLVLLQVYLQFLKAHLQIIAVKTFQSK